MSFHDVNKRDILPLYKGNYNIKSLEKQDADVKKPQGFYTKGFLIWPLRATIKQQNLE
jgi:hypothetical protein